MDELDYWIALHGAPEMGPVVFRRLLDRFGSCRVILEETERNDLAAVRGMTAERIEGVVHARSGLDHARKLLDTLRRAGVRALRMTDADYPAALQELPNPPPLIYLFGDIRAQDRRAVAMVGTTKPSGKGRAIAEELAARLAGKGLAVVSGFAHGVDAAAHRGAFKGGGRSILCIPFGIRQFRPRPDFPPLEEIAQRGAILSECPPDAEWSSRAAIQRNRIIAALGAATVVIETRPRGGTMHTVKAAVGLLRPLFALKYREPPESARGNAILIARGATPITMLNDAEKILAVLPDAE